MKLTQFSKGAGCGCKIAPNVLEQILKTNFVPELFPQLLVGNESNDDAAVYDLQNGSALISSTDFFMPIVDDAFQFGQIAAANAISDIYAMGGKPILATAILGWPLEKIPVEIAQQVLDGARHTCAGAHIPLAGGHSIDSAEPIFGLSVNGLVANAELKRNNTAKAGDSIYMSKALGVGILSTAQKRDVLAEEDQAIMLQQLTQLNTIGQTLGAYPWVTAMTDITGFGLLGHLIEMMKGSKLSAAIEYAKIPILEPCKKYLAQRIVPDATYRNWNSYSNDVQFAAGVNVMEAFSILPDPQTNGGLLFTVSDDEAMQALIQSHNWANTIVRIGKTLMPSAKIIEIL